MTAAGERAARRRSRLAETGLPLVAAAAAAGWLVVLLGARDPAAWMPLKGAPTALLAIWALVRRRQGGGAGALAAALACHAAGDLLLEVALLAGMAAFLAGHLIYIRLFWSRRLAFRDIGGREKLALGALALVSAGVLAVTAHRLHGVLAIAVPVYAAALAAMSGTAWLSWHGRPWVPAGATLFLLSDALLALELFGTGVPSGRPLVWSLYALGQLAIACGWLCASEPARSPAAAG